MAIYKFKITFEDYDEISREIEIKSNQTFEDLHRAIHRSTGYSPEKSSSFYVSTDNWIKGDEIAYLPNKRKEDQGVALMGKSKLSAFIEDPHQKFYYTYNFERPYDFHVELIRIILDADPNIEYPFLAKSVGEAPKIFDKNLPAAAAETAKSDEFDFLNDMDFVPEDTDELEAMGEMGINEQEREGEDTEEEGEGDEFSDEFSDNENYDEDGHKNDY
ncbi:hypothetical protein C7T94_16035 [Pedobacter yulinensis]|uniref:Plasmid pRiA4b Orf3-like domain-containing protein n=1 Tax=Pedobacter yulinensis TaxID=2126353 RepID=A0A2T3HIN2_9SPHI|nr:hypothetical protein [Pedobacter yulinensis]PST82298.1 hypothetical protein C7T94_16035 [Pedobacter yulinensis]